MELVFIVVVLSDKPKQGNGHTKNQNSIESPIEKNENLIEVDRVFYNLHS